jgi:hypothetical protein
VSTLVLTERPLRLWDEPGARSFRAPDATPPAPPSAPPHHAPDAPPHDDASGHHGADASPHDRDAAPPHARLTLADVLAAAWDGLATRSTVACPVCHGELAPHGAGGRCRSCGTTLS